MPKKNLIYTVSKGDETVMTGTAIEIAEHFNVSYQTVGNCERTGNKLKKEYLIERVGWGDHKDDVELDERIKKDLSQGLSRMVIAKRLGVNRNVVDKRIELMRERGEL